MILTSHPSHREPAAARQPMMRRLLKTALFAVMCVGCAWPLSSASAADRVIALWDASAPGADSGMLPGGANSEAGDLKMPATSSATIEKDAAAPGGQALVFPTAKGNAQCTTKVSVTGDFTIELIVKISPANDKIESPILIVHSPFIRLRYQNGSLRFIVMADGGGFVERPIAPDKWSKVTATMKGGMITLDVDGDVIDKNMRADAKLNDEEYLIRVGLFVGALSKLSITAH
ncbi:MAG: hypothetical protein ACOYM3_15245 [Terrimicrobiaceae bacterium]